MSQQKSSTETAQMEPSVKIKKGTPPGKQAKRDENARLHWKKAAVEKTEKIKSERRMKNETRKQRDQLKLELELKVIELSNSEMLRNAAEQQHKEEHQKRIKVEKKLDEITEQLQSTEKILKSMVVSQGEVTKKIHQVHLDLNEHFQNEHQLSDRIEDLDFQNSILANEIKIDLKIEELEKNTQSIREELQKEEKAHQERKQKITEEKKRPKIKK